MVKRRKRRHVRKEGEPEAADLDVEGEDEDMSISTLENLPDPDFDPATIPNPLGKQPQPEGEVPAGSSGPDMSAPSVQGTSQDEKRGEKEDSRRKDKEKE